MKKPLYCVSTGRKLTEEDYKNPFYKKVRYSFKVGPTGNVASKGTKWAIGYDPFDGHRINCFEYDRKYQAKIEKIIEFTEGPIMFVIGMIGSILLITFLILRFY